MYIFERRVKPYDLGRSNEYWVWARKLLTYLYLKIFLKIKKGIRIRRNFLYLLSIGKKSKWKPSAIEN